MSAPNEVTVKGTDYENFRWAHIWQDADTGGVFPLALYTIEYAIADESGNLIHTLTQPTQVFVNTTTGLVTYDLGEPLPAGTYSHSGRKITLAGNVPEAVFDGAVVITDGAFA